MIKFITEDKKDRELTFADVKINQFFINGYGSLCQKLNSLSYTVIALKGGTPCASFMWDIPYDQTIQRILPHVTKIEF